MSGLLDELYRLQERLRFVHSRERERDTVPVELTAVDRDYKEKLEAVQRTVDLASVRARFVSEEDGWGRFLFVNVFQVAIVGNAWREARGKPIVQGREGG